MEYSILPHSNFTWLKVVSTMFGCLFYSCYIFDLYLLGNFCWQASSSGTPAISEHHHHPLTGPCHCRMLKGRMVFALFFFNPPPWHAKSGTRGPYRATSHMVPPPNRTNPPPPPSFPRSIKKQLELFLQRTQLLTVTQSHL